MLYFTKPGTSQMPCYHLPRHLEGLWFCKPWQANELLGNISSAPLKPQQCLFILNNNLIPALYYQLVLTVKSKMYLRRLDRSIRAAVRTWLTLQHDTSKAYFHAKILAGGLGIVKLEHRVLLMKIKRVNRLWDSLSIRKMPSTDRAETLLAWQREPSCYGGMQITSKESL